MSFPRPAMHLLPSSVPPPPTSSSPHPPPSPLISDFSSSSRLFLFLSSSLFFFGQIRVATTTITTATTTTISTVTQPPSHEPYHHRANPNHLHCNPNHRRENTNQHSEPSPPPPPQVSYETHGFIDKNNDSIHDELLEIVSSSSNAFVRSLVPRTGKNGVPSVCGIMSEKRWYASMQDLHANIFVATRVSRALFPAETENDHSQRSSQMKNARTDRREDGSSLCRRSSTDS